MKTRFLVALLATTIAISPMAHAARTPEPGGADPRVKHIVYHKQDVVELKGHYGFTSAVEFASDEEVSTISIGDSTMWQVIPVKNLLVLKPLTENATTNLLVVTNKRVYSFELSASPAISSKSKRLNYRVQFVYPDEELDMLATVGMGPRATTRLSSEASTPADWNFKYTYSGTTNLRPTQIFDNGKFTYFQFADINRTPAIFVVDDHGNESLVNFHKEGDYLVIHRLSRQFTLRDGEDVTCIFNEGFPKVDFASEPLAPVPASRVTPVESNTIGGLDITSASKALKQQKDSFKR
jgi:type IV secretion system protein VirB9